MYMFMQKCLFQIYDFKITAAVKYDSLPKL
jgi:hypothetical protein